MVLSPYSFPGLSLSFSATQTWLCLARPKLAARVCLGLASKKRLGRSRVDNGWIDSRVAASREADGRKIELRER